MAEYEIRPTEKGKFAIYKDGKYKTYRDTEEGAETYIADQSTGSKTVDINLGGTTVTHITDGKIETVKDLTEEQFIMRVTELFPYIVLQEMYKLIGCECTIDAYDKFMNTPFKITLAMQSGLIEFYRKLFNERIRKSTCSSCWKSRISRLRSRIKDLDIDHNEQK